MADATQNLFNQSQAAMNTTLTPANNDLANSFVGQGKTIQQMMDAGLDITQAQTIANGFNGTFGGQTGGQGSTINAADWRQQNGFTVDPNTGQVGSNKPVNQQVSSNINNPVLPNNTTLVPSLQSVQPSELQNSANYQLNGNPSVAAPTAQAAQIQGAQAPTTQTVDPNAATAGVQAQTVQSTLTNPNAVGQGQAAQGTVNPLDTVQGQLASLYASANGTVPPWAQAAYQSATNFMAARGISSSSIAAGAVTAAYMQSATNIAASDAATYFQMDMQNLSNTQQMNLQDLQNRQQDMLTDTAISNATAQFNATSTQQTQQFVANLISSIQSNNASMTNNMAQFNTSQANSIAAQNATNTQQASQFNAQMQSSTDQFNSNLENNRQQFNSSMAYAVDQSNVLWQRSVNTANTAAVNAANQTNVQNMFNMSQSALNQTWQEMQDNASWAFQASQTQAEMNYNTALASGNRSFLQSMSNGQNATQLFGSLLTNGLLWSLTSPSSSSSTSS